MGAGAYSAIGSSNDPDRIPLPDWRNRARRREPTCPEVPGRFSRWRPSSNVATKWKMKTNCAKKRSPRRAPDLQRGVGVGSKGVLETGKRRRREVAREHGGDLQNVIDPISPGCIALSATALQRRLRERAEERRHGRLSRSPPLPAGAPLRYAPARDPCSRPAGRRLPGPSLRDSRDTSVPWTDRASSIPNVLSI